MTERVLFVKIAYCEEGVPSGQFSYVQETGAALEKYNFCPILYQEREVCLAFFEPGSNQGYKKSQGKRNQVCIEKIDPIFARKAIAGDVTVIWCARVDNRFSTVGWFRQADVFRYPQKPSKNEIPWKDEFPYEDGYIYNVVADRENCVLLPKEEFSQACWLAPLSRKDGFGFGQSCHWYALERTHAAESYWEKTLAAIRQYGGENQITARRTID
jgi:hypothetical protein